MTPAEIRRRRMMELGPHMTELPNIPTDITKVDPALLDNALKMMAMREADEAYSLAGREAPMEPMGEYTPPPSYPPPEGAGGYATPETEGAVQGAGELSGRGSSGGGWTSAATLALANSLPALISAAYQREGPPAGRSVGGGKPAFKMEDPFKERGQYRSLLAQYLRR